MADHIKIRIRCQMIGGPNVDREWVVTPTIYRDKGPLRAYALRVISAIDTGMPRRHTLKIDRLEETA